MKMKPQRLAVLSLVSISVFLSAIQGRTEESEATTPVRTEPPPCAGAYALCTSAPCERIAHSQEATCTCDVVFGINLGPSKCPPPSESPTRGGSNLISAYSFEQTAVNKLMICSGKFEFVQCLKAPCTVDATNPAQAQCTCKIERTPNGESWVTMGGGCATNTCGSTLWSGAPMKTTAGGNAELLAALKLEASALPVTCCPDTAPPIQNLCWSPTQH